MNETANPFFQPSDAPHGTMRFDLLRTEHFRPALVEGMAREKKEIEDIANNPAKPTFDNTIAAMEKTGDLLERTTTVMYNLLSAETNDELEALAQEMSPMLSEHSSDIMLNEALFARVKAVYDENPDLDAEDRMLLEKTYEAFERSGATLDAAGKKRFREIKSELSRLTLQFSQNNLKETNAFTLHVTDEQDLAGLPPMQVEQAAQTAREHDTDGWVFTLHAPSYQPFMTYADNRELRRRLYMAYNTKCTHDNAQNNFGIVARLVNLRRELAQLLGYDTYADYVLKRRMAERTENVYELLERLIGEYKAPALREVEAVAEKARREEGGDFVLQPWDFAYYAHKLQKERFDLDAEMLRPYFELSRVKQGVFGLATRLYGITFRENKNIPVYHPDVTAYEVFDEDGSYLAVLYTDFHPRSSKQGGAWMTNYKDEWDGTSRPHVSVTMNFTRPTADKPALLTLSEVETFLHEFGHALHGIFATTKHRSLSGTNVYWDFVELPSQFMENYAVEKDFLRTFAFHHESGEPIPEDLIRRIVEARNFNVAYACMRQVSFGLLDMAYYTLRTPFNADVRAFEKEAWQAAQLLPRQEETCMSVQFGHIMAGGYSAGYYSYKWAEVLDADAFDLFRQNGIFDRETARSFRTNVLSQGGTRPPMQLYRAFRGKEPDIDALLRRNGLK